MAKVAVKVYVNQGYVRGVVAADGLGGRAVRRAATTTARRARENVVRAGRVRTGKMRDTIKAGKAVRHGSRVRIQVNSGVPYSVYQEYGIGPVVPIRAKALRFVPKGGGGVVFAKRTRGFPGAFFMRDALRALNVQDFIPPGGGAAQ